MTIDSVSPIVNEEVGVTFYIRNVNSSNINKKILLKGTATEEMLYFLTSILKYKVSICVAGATGSGKTALLNWIICTLSNDLRIMTIESASNELDLVRKDKDGNILNNVIHTKTKDEKIYC